jgi:hypothetical protein
MPHDKPRRAGLVASENMKLAAAKRSVGDLDNNIRLGLEGCPTN